MRKNNKSGKPSEAQEQEALFAWADDCIKYGFHPELKMMFAIPNGGRRDSAEAAHLKRQGVRAGVPDICLAVARGGFHGLYIEMKVEPNKPTKNQKDWLANLYSQGFATKICYGCSEARIVIENYLSMPPTVTRLPLSGQREKAST